MEDVSYGEGLGPSCLGLEGGVDGVERGGGWREGEDEEGEEDAEPEDGAEGVVGEEVDFGRGHIGI